jgi:murein DD-endopeptidase MepM/ murein hydrolase activator NlpD
MGLKVVGVGVGAFLCLGAWFALEDALYPEAHAAGAQPQPQKPRKQPQQASAPKSFKGDRIAPVDLAVNTPYHYAGSQWATGYHTGVDYPAKSGTPVRAAASGTVVKSGWNVDGSAYGIALVIKHGDKLYTQYAHLSKVMVSKGDSVKVGDRIAFSGGTGMKSTGPHLHFEVRTGPNYRDDINPTKWLSGK